MTLCADTPRKKSGLKDYTKVCPHEIRMFFEKNSTKV